MLSQRDKSNGQFRPIDYFSSSLSPAQRNYSAGQLEAWALVAACRKWSVHLRGSGKVELITDHNPLPGFAAKMPHDARLRGGS